MRCGGEAADWELDGRKALRKDDWKIVHANEPWGGKWELHNYEDLAYDARLPARTKPD